MAAEIRFRLSDERGEAVEFRASAANLRDRLNAALCRFRRISRAVAVLARYAPQYGAKWVRVGPSGIGITGEIDERGAAYVWRWAEAGRNMGRQIGRMIRDVGDSVE